MVLKGVCVPRGKKKTMCKLNECILEESVVSINRVLSNVNVGDILVNKFVLGECTIRVLCSEYVYEGVSVELYINNYYRDCKTIDVVDLMISKYFSDCNILSNKVKMFIPDIRVNNESPDINELPTFILRRPNGDFVLIGILDNVD